MSVIFERETKAEEKYPKIKGVVDGVGGLVIGSILGAVTGGMLFIPVFLIAAFQDEENVPTNK